LKGCRVPKLAFAIRLRETFCPSEDLRDLFAGWLRNIPAIAGQVKVEAGFDAFSALVIVSLPLDLSAYLSQDPAVISLGPIILGTEFGRATSMKAVSVSQLRKPKKNRKKGR
jgi:hypothetical protein